MSYVGAPYNFIPFPQKTHAPVSETDLKVHDRIDDSLMTGEITYKIEAKTPIIVDDGKGRFFKNENGKYAIPGSTIRGLLRNNVQILSVSSFDEDIDDYKLMYRNVTNGSLKNKYNNVLGNIPVPYGEGSISVLKNVKGGVISCKKGKYYINPTKCENVEKNLSNYYVLSEKTIVDSYLRDGSDFKYDLFLEDGNCIMQNLIDVPFTRQLKPLPENEQKESIKDELEREKTIYYAKKENRNKYYYELYNSQTQGSSAGFIYTNPSKDTVLFDENKTQITIGKIHYIGGTNKTYKPYFKHCSYVASGKNIKAVSDPDRYPDKGILISTGRMNEKKAVYIIPEIDMAGEKTISIPASDVKAFKIDFKKKENTLRSFFDKKDKKKAAKEAEAFYGLPAEGQTKPVFYIYLKGRLYFGFTPRLRLFYEHPIKEGYKQEKAGNEKYDLTTSLFGMSDKNKGSYKSKVSMTDATLMTGNADDAKRIVLAEPKPLSYLDYLVQKTNNKSDQTYSSEDFELRGIKQYWLREELYYDNQNRNNENVGSRITPLKTGSIFTGKIRFNNLTSIELGLLLWALRLDEGSRMNIGKGKPYGYGQIVVTDIMTKILDNKQAYGLGKLILNPLKEKDTDKLIEEYKNIVIFGTKVSELDSVKTFLKMKDSRKMPNPEQIRYMSIDAPLKEYQKRNTEHKPLGTVDEVLNGKFSKPPKVNNGGYRSNKKRGYYR